jgi:DNA polymerase elongation subunit (family B)
MQKSYIGIANDYRSDQLMVWERPVAGGPRTLRYVKPPRYFYVPDEDGQYTSIFRQKLSRLDFDSKDEFDYAKRRYSQRYESDIQPLYKCLMNEYYGVPTPQINFALFDIEVDYDSKLGFSSHDNPYAPINAITIYQSWTKEYITVVVPPKGWDRDVPKLLAEIKKVADDAGMKDRPAPIIAYNERELIDVFLDAIEEADIISGWNSDFFDIPYIVQRLMRLFGDQGHSKLCFPGAPRPRSNVVQRFGSPSTTYTLYGRTHLDYLQLFQKFTFEGRTSYALGNILQEEVGLGKIDYEGTLEQLYNNDFARFTVYNFRDVSGMVDLDAKFKFIQLVNQMAHENTCQFMNILGTVRYVETGIMNFAHHVHQLICPDKFISSEKNRKVEGAVVLSPQKGLHKWLGSVDINSLYPSVIRALNMSVETFVGQFQGEDLDWIALFDDRERKRNVTKHFKQFGTLHNVRYRSPEDMLERRAKSYSMYHADGSTTTKTWFEWRDWLKDNKYSVSAFGTVFNQEHVGMVAGVLTFWYGERKRLQAEKKKWGKIVKDLSAEYSEYVAKHSGGSYGDSDELHERIKNATAEAEKIYGSDLNHAKRQEEHFDLLQLTKKIQLNSTYGALLNEAFLFGRREIGASVTATGREITLFMNEQIGTAATGEAAEIEKYMAIETDDEGYPEVVNIYISACDANIAADTDSAYFKTYAENKEDAVAIADHLADHVNEMFPGFMEKFFNTQGDRSKLIVGGREIVGKSGLFMDVKKKYTIKVVDKEGKAVDELKSMGSELKKADTPKVVQNFLKALMELVLDSEPYPTIEKFVNDNRIGLIKKNSEILALGTAKQVNNLDSKYAEWERVEKPKKGKVNLPGHVRAAINYNELVKQFEEGAKQIQTGDKVVIFYVKMNQFNIKSIGFPSDKMHVPEWFTENFQVDMALTEEKLIDAKLAGIFNALDWEVPTLQRSYLSASFDF